MLYLGLISPLSWKRVLTTAAASFILFTLRLWSHYGMTRIRDDLYIHFVTVVTIVGIIVKSKEAFDRVQFANLSIIKGQAKHWHQVLDQLEEGVLLF